MIFIIYTCTDINVEYNTGYKNIKLIELKFDLFLDKCGLCLARHKCELCLARLCGCVDKFEQLDLLEKWQRKKLIQLFPGHCKSYKSVWTPL